MNCNDPTCRSEMRCKWDMPISSVYCEQTYSVTPEPVVTKEIKYVQAQQKPEPKSNWRQPTSYMGRSIDDIRRPKD